MIFRLLTDMKGCESEGEKDLILDLFSDIRIENDHLNKYQEFCHDLLDQEQELTGYDENRILKLIHLETKRELSHSMPITCKLQHRTTQQIIGKLQTRNFINLKPKI